MRISATCNQPIKQTNFGNVTATKRAVAYLNQNLSPEKVEKFGKIVAEQNGKKPDIFLHIGEFQKITTGGMMPYLRAKVGENVFQEGIFTTPFGVIKEAANYVNSLNKKAHK